MKRFEGFTTPLWRIFTGTLLMLVTILFYIAWWTATYHPILASYPAAPVILLLITFFVGANAITFLAIGINALPRTEKGIRVLHILLGTAVLYIILLVVTTTIFRRMLTEELLLITFWAGMEWSLISALYSSGHFSRNQAVWLSVLIGLATLTGLFCYVLHYHLDGNAGFWNGLIPLVIDSCVVLVLLSVIATPRRWNFQKMD